MVMGTPIAYGKFMEIMDGRTNAVQEPTAVGRDIAYQVAD
jgi:hypothetical protein